MGTAITPTSSNTSLKYLGSVDNESREEMEESARREEEWNYQQ